MAKQKTKHRSNTHQQYSSLETLLEQQDEVRREYKEIEDDLVSSILNPVRISKTVISNVLGLTRNKSKSNKKRISRFANRDTGRKNKNFELIDEAAEMLPVMNAPVLPEKNKRSFGKKVLISFVKWQAFNLAVWGIGKGWDAYQEHRAKNKIVRDLKKEKKSLLAKIRARFN